MLCHPLVCQEVKENVSTNTISPVCRYGMTELTLPSIIFLIMQFGKSNLVNDQIIIIRMRERLVWWLSKQHRRNLINNIVRSIISTDMKLKYEIFPRNLSSCSYFLCYLSVLVYLLDISSQVYAIFVWVFSSILMSKQ